MIYKQKRMEVASMSNVVIIAMMSYLAGVYRRSILQLVKWMLIKAGRGVLFADECIQLLMASFRRAVRADE